MPNRQPATRMEKDSVGEIAVPAAAYYGAQTARAVENYPISGLRAHPFLIRAYGLLKLACAEANLELKMIPPRIGRAIVRASRDVAQGKLNDQFVVDVYQAGAGVSFHMNVNEVIANRAIEHLGGKRGDYSVVHPNDHVNFGQSTNDTFPTAMRLAVLLLLEEFYPALDELVAAFDAKAKEFDTIVKSGRTHLQDAVPIRLGQVFSAYGVGLWQAREEIERGAQTLAALGIGGSAVGTGLNAHPRFSRQVVERLRKHTGLTLTGAGDLVAAMQSQLPMAAASGALRNLALELIRIANDLRLLSSGPYTALAEIALPALQPGSSIMPGKVNPVMAELLDMVAFQVVGCDTVVAMAVQAGQLELNVMMPAMAWNVLHAIEILKNTCRVVAQKCVLGITANREICERYAYRTPSIATALNPVIGYSRAAQIVKKALATGKSIPEICLEEKVLTKKELDRVLDPHRMTRPGLPPKRIGGK
ncbi:MAG TPA: aspartate ammonia-lyase [Terriglobia bacterium]|nr:aspartate ammonia-lyase [Terriglobia bacterium]